MSQFFSPSQSCWINTDLDTAALLSYPLTKREMRTFLSTIRRLSMEKSRREMRWEIPRARSLPRVYVAFRNRCTQYRLSFLSYRLTSRMSWLVTCVQLTWQPNLQLIVTYKSHPKTRSPATNPVDSVLSLLIYLILPCCPTVSLITVPSSNNLWCVRGRKLAKRTR